MSSDGILLSAACLIVVAAFLVTLLYIITHPQALEQLRRSTAPIDKTRRHPSPRKD